MNYDITDKIKNAVRAAFSTFPVMAAAGGVAAIMTFGSPVFAKQATLPDVNQSTWSASEFVHGVRDEANGRSTLADGAVPATPREAGSQWQRINEMSPGEIRSLAGIVFHANKGLREVNDHLRKQMQGAGVPFIEAEQVAWKVVLTGAMVGDRDPFDVSLEDAIRLSNDTLAEAFSAHPTLRQALMDASTNAEVFMELSARGENPSFDPVNGATSTPEVTASELWYKVDNLEASSLRALSFMITGVEPRLSEVLDDMVVRLTDEDIPPREALALADSAILAGAMVTDAGAQWNIDPDRAGPVVERLRQKVSDEYSPAVYHIVSEGIDRAKRIDEPDTSPEPN